MPCQVPPSLPIFYSNTRSDSNTHSIKKRKFLIGSKGLGPTIKPSPLFLPSYSRIGKYTPIYTLPDHRKWGGINSPFGEKHFPHAFGESHRLPLC
ncbi:hypothetical protein HanIR_Chr17g0846861 [Helianthus annuus]|nr:hypothetical protein HanIR_Chr17g0846861 [Helianthus annuus]